MWPEQSVSTNTGTAPILRMASVVAKAESGVGPQRTQCFVSQRGELAQHGVHAARGRTRAAELVEQRQLVGTVGVTQR